jgi:hypothetical protein
MEFFLKNLTSLKNKLIFALRIKIWIRPKAAHADEL